MSHVKSEHLSQKRNYMGNVLQPTRSLCHFRFKSYGPLSVFHKSGDLDLALYPIFKKKSSALSRDQMTSSANKIRTIGLSGAACRAFEDGQTDKHKQTNRGDQYTFRKVFRKVIRGAIIGDYRYYIDFNWPWPLTLTFDLDLDLHLFCKKKRNVVTSREAKQRLAYKNGNSLPIGISSRINLQPTRSLYHFRFKS